MENSTISTWAANYSTGDGRKQALESKTATSLPNLEQPMKEQDQDLVVEVRPEQKEMGNFSCKVKPTSCREKHCMEYLTSVEKQAIRSCERETTVKFHVPLELFKEPVCSFMNKKGRTPVALISHEGSGNTWVRGLLEKTTGICTGFLWCDYKMRQYGFLGENVRSGSVLVVKTHSTSPRWQPLNTYERRVSRNAEPYYGSAVFVLRNPHDSSIAEWNRRATNGILRKEHLPHNESHTNVIPKDLFRELSYWASFG